MVKKKTTLQNIVIVILSILLTISVGFGVTYSYYNGKSDLVKGTITTANLSIDLYGENVFGQTTEFSISAPVDESFLVPGTGLNNLKLNLFNQCNQKTYMVVLYSLSAMKTMPNGSKVNITNELNTTPAIDFKSDAYDSAKWKSISYDCQNTSGTYTCLVGINPFEAKTPGSEGYFINVLKDNSIKIPEQWTNILQNCDVTISITAYAIQAENLPAEYSGPITTAHANQNMEAKSQAIANAVLEICGVDSTNA